MKPRSSISEIKSIYDVLLHHLENSIILFDLDNTLVRPARAQDLGSDQFYTTLHQHISDVLGDPELARLYCVAICDFLQNIIDAKPVESDAAHVINMLKSKDLLVLGLTARSISIEDATLKQLRQAGVDLSNPIYKTFKLNIENSSRNVWYKNGVIYCDGANKGKCFTEFLKETGLKCASIIVIDDTKKNLIHIQEAAEKLEIPYVGLRYGAMDERVSRFEMSRSLTQLLKIQGLGLFTPEVNNIVNKLKSEETDKSMKLNISLASF